MTILLSEHLELYDQASQKLRIWKIWHTTLYILAAIFGIVNSAFLFQIESLVADRCIFYPKQLAFHWVELPNATHDSNYTQVPENYTEIPENSTEEVPRNSDGPRVTKRELPVNVSASESGDDNGTLAQPPVLEDGKENVLDNATSTTTSIISNETRQIITMNTTHALMLFTDRSVFPTDSDSGCQFAEYMPLLSATFAIVWATLFIVCPSGGRASRLQQPWRILTPALIFAIVMLILTGVSFFSTNGGLLAFCAAFKEETNSTACAPVNKYLERSWNSTFPIGGRIAATRAASAAVLACWAVICAVLLSRCLAGPDFVLKRTTVSIVKDPAQKVTPYLLKRKSSQQKQRSTNSSPNKRDNISVRSEPTITTELVTVSVEHEDDSQSTSLATTPLKERPGEGIEMQGRIQEGGREDHSPPWAGL